MPKHALLFPLGERIHGGTCTLEQRLDGVGYTYRAVLEDGAQRVVKFESKEDRLAKLSERKILSYLRRCGAHPSVATEHEEGTHKGVPYFIRPYFPGIDLADIVKRCGPMPPGVVAQLGADVCSAVDWIHKHNVIHCDLKPANILIPVPPSRRIYPLIIDFGYAVRKSKIWDLFSGLVRFLTIAMNFVELHTSYLLKFGKVVNTTCSAMFMLLA